MFSITGMGSVTLNYFDLSLALDFVFTLGIVFSPLEVTFNLIDYSLSALPIVLFSVIVSSSGERYRIRHVNESSRWNYCCYC